MGIFDSLFGKKEKPATPDFEPAPHTVHSPPSWRDRFADAARAPHFDWTWGNAAAHKIIHTFLNEAKGHFGDGERPAQIKERPDDEHIDLRGNYKNSPIRFAVWMSFGSFWTIEMKVPMLSLIIDIERDLEKVPHHGDESDPFDDEDERRVFVAKGIYFEGDEESIARKLELWAALPEPRREAIARGMEAVDARSLYYAADSVHLNQTPGLPELEDPIAYMLACADLLAELRDAAAEADFPRVDRPAPREARPMRVGCSYCSSLYFMSTTNPRCPNCGAPPRA